MGFKASDYGDGSKYDSMSIGQLRQLAESGDQGAIDYQRESAKQLKALIEPLRDLPGNFAKLMPPTSAIDGDIKLPDIAAEKRAAAERETRTAEGVEGAQRGIEALVELMRRNAEEQAERDRRGEEREERMADLTEQALRWGRIGAVAAVVAVVATCISLVA